MGDIGSRLEALTGEGGFGEGPPLAGTCEGLFGKTRHLASPRTPSPPFLREIPKSPTRTRTQTKTGSPHVATDTRIVKTGQVR